MSIAQINGVDVIIYGFHYEDSRLMVDARSPLSSRVLSYPAVLVDILKLISKEDKEDVKN